MGLNIGDLAPDFTLPTDSSGTITLSSLRGKPVVVYFYPKDDTPGCTKEACAFRDNLPHFNTQNAVVIGISKDSATKHDKFKVKYGLNFPLAADEDGKTCEAYGVWTEKSMYGKTYMGIQRATFLIDQNGKIAQIWPKVSVPGHAEDVLKAVQALGNSSAAA